MKKFMRFIAVGLCAAMLFSGCGKDAKESTDASPEASADAETENQEKLTRGDIKFTDYCIVKDYKGIHLTKEETDVTDEEMQKQIGSLIDSCTTVEEITEDRAVQEGDTVNIDYVGYMDGEAFENGADEDYDLVIGSNTFIEGFETGLIGAKKGQQLDVEATFPDPYKNNPDFSGKTAVFKVTVNAIKEEKVPEFNDELVKNNTSYSTVEEFKENVGKNISDSKKREAVIAKLVESAQYAEEYPESLVTYHRENCLAYYEQIFPLYYGTTLEEYIKQLGTDEDGFVKDYLWESLEETIREELVLGAIIELENIQAEGEDYENYVSEMAENYGSEPEAFKEQYGENEIQFSYGCDAVLELVMNSAVIE